MSGHPDDFPDREQGQVVRCPYCGIPTASPCDEFPATTCEQALNAFWGEA